MNVIRRLLSVLRGPAPIYLASAVLARLGSMLLIPMYTRRLSPGEYGDFALAQSALAFLPLVFTLGLVSAVPKFYYADEDRKVGRQQAGGVAVWLAVFTLGFATLTGSGIALFVKPGASGQMPYLLICITVAAAGSALSSVPDLFLRAEQRPWLAAAFQMLQFGLQVGLGLAFVLRFDRGLRGAIEALAIAYSVSGLLGLIFIFSYLHGRLSRRILRLALPFALPFLPHFIANWAQLMADRWTMKFFHLESTLGAYVLAIQLTSPIAMAVAAWNDTESARMGETLRSHGLQGVRDSASRVRRNYFFVALVSAVGIVAAIPILSAVVGARFVSALHLIPVMAAFSVVESMYFPNSNILYYASRTRTIAGVTISMAALNIVLNLALIPFFGAAGALTARFLTAVGRSAAIWKAAHACLADTPVSAAAITPPNAVGSESA